MSSTENTHSTSLFENGVLNEVNYNNLRTTDPDLCSLMTRKQPRFMPSAPKCANCNKSVYKAEEIRAANKTFHKLCFKCTQCCKLLETNILTEHAGDLFCRNCYAKSFGPKGVGFGNGTMSSENGSYMSLSSHQRSLSRSGSEEQNSEESQSIRHVQVTPSMRSTFSTLTNTTSPPPTNGSYQMSALNYEKRSTGASIMTFGGSDKCARCCKPVYAAEKVFAAGKPFHKLCFSCSTCKKLLSSMNCCDNSESEIFCKGCYGKQYGPKGVGFGLQAGIMQPNYK